MQNVFKKWKSINNQYDNCKTDVEYDKFLKENKKSLALLSELTYPDLLSKNNPVITSRGGGGDYLQKILNPTRTGEIDLSFEDAKSGLFIFSVPGDNWPNSKDRYKVEIKFNKTGATSLAQLDVMVKCDCPFFIYNGPEHNAKVNGYLFQNPYGTAEEPDIRDPSRVYYICKHISAVFSLINKKFRFPPSWFIPQQTSGNPIQENLLKEESGLKLKHLADIRTNFEDADFWIIRRGTPEKVGKPTKEYNREHIGVKVTATDKLDPGYLYYFMKYIWSNGVYKEIATGTLKLVNIETKHIKDIPIGQKF